MKALLPNPFGFDEWLVMSDRHPADPKSEHFVFGFPNGYGLSVLRANFSFGNMAGFWETALMRKDGTGKLSLCNEGLAPHFKKGDPIYVCEDGEEVGKLLAELKELSA